MKKILSAIILVFILSGCNATSTFSDDHPFIVKEFASYNKDYNIYYSHQTEFFTTNNSRIIAPIGFYIGDTIKLDLNKLRR